MFPLTNAVLVEITTPGPLDDTGDPGTPITVWTGRAAGYLKRVRRNTRSGDQQTPVRTDTFTILDTLGAPVLEAAGPDWEQTTITVEDRRIPNKPPVLRRYGVNAMEHRQTGSIVDSVRLELERASV